MRIPLIVFTILLSGIPVMSYAGLFGPGNYAECILKYMPATTTRQASNAVRKMCFDDFPNGYTGIKKATSIFGVMSREECEARYLQPLNTAGAKLDIKTACGVLYSPVLRR